MVTPKSTVTIHRSMKSLIKMRETVIRGTLRTAPPLTGDLFVQIRRIAVSRAHGGLLAARSSPILPFSSSAVDSRAS
jgi:hypothetical protein